MAAFKFSKSQFSSSTQEDWEFETVGIFGEIPAMKGKKVQFTKKNLKGDSRVTLQLFPKKYKDLKEAIADEAVEFLPCTKPLSKMIRKAVASGVPHNKILGHLVTLEIQQSIEEPEKYFLFSEKGDGEALPAYLVDELEETSYADLEVAF